ncbi:MAG TPA: hypothetical protein VH968_02950 [Gaiellaceae bacterium]|jgi:hypothetical protein
MTTAIHRTKWFLPGFAVLLGLVFFAGFWIGDDRGSALWSLGVMTVFGALILAGGRFELVRGLRGDGRDEYWARMDLHATALAGLTAITAILVMCLWEWAHGRDGSPYVQLGALSGVAYLLALGFLRWRS